MYLFLSFCESWMCHYMHMFTASPPSPTDICSMCQVSLPVKMGRRLLNDRPALSRPHITFTELYKMFQRNFCVLSILSIHSHQFWCVSFSIFVFRCCFSLIASWKSSLFCLCMSWMCLQLHFRTNSLQPEFNSKKKNRTRLRQIFRFHVVTSLFRMFTVAHCMFLSRFLFRWYMLFYSHRSCFAQKPFSLWFQVLFIFGFGVCLQPKSFLSLDFYLFICLLLLRFFFH